MKLTNFGYIKNFVKIRKVILKVDKGKTTFIKPSKYFNGSESHLLRNSLDIFSKHLGTYDKFLDEPNSRILLLSAPGGHGKSHLLRLISERNKKILIQVAQNVLGEICEIKSRITRKKIQVILWDDAERKLEDTTNLIQVALQNPNLKVVMALRVAGEQIINEIISQERAELIVFTKKIKIGAWDRNNLISLLRLAAETSQKIQDENEIVKIYPDPYLITWIGKNFTNNKNVSIRNLRDRFVSDILNDSKLCLKGLVQEERINDFLLLLSCLVPIRDYSIIYENSISKYLCERFGLSNGDLIKVFKKLEKAGVIRSVGHFFRFNPDPKGDFLLANFLQNQNSTKEIFELLVPIFSFSQREVFINIKAASRFAADSNLVLKTFYKSLLIEWSNQAVDANPTEKTRNLTSLENFIEESIYPGLNLIELYIELEKPYTKAHSNTVDVRFGLGQGNIARCLIPICGHRNPNVRKRILDIVLQSKTKNIPFLGHNYSPENLMGILFDPRQDKGIISYSLGYVEGWLNQDVNKEKLDLIKSALNRLLSCCWQTVETNKFIFPYIEGNPDQIEIRNQAGEFLKGY